jgi:hypothetical protein
MLLWSDRLLWLQETSFAADLLPLQQTLRRPGQERSFANKSCILPGAHLLEFRICEATLPIYDSQETQL